MERPGEVSLKKPSLTVFKPTFLLSDHRSLRACFLKSLPVSKTLFQKHHGRVSLILAVSGARGGKPFQSDGGDGAVPVGPPCGGGDDILSAYGVWFLEPSTVT